MLLTYSVGAWLCIEVFNNLGGGYIQHWYEEYYANGAPGMGSLKWRSSDGQLFSEFALLVGTWVYPFCVIASVLYMKRAFSTSGRAGKLAAVVGALLCLMVLARFLQLGVFTAVAPQ